MEFTTTVVLTTFNGTKYLEPLLDSLRLQTRSIDQVLIFDDSSSDNTVELVSDYINKYHLTKWNLKVNKPNKGWKKNFRDGIIEAEGDVIFPCDQDDIWELNKVEIMTSILEQNSNILLLSSDYVPVYEKDAKKVDDLSDLNNINNLEHIECNEKFSVHTRPGCVMAVRKKLVKELSYIWGENYAHDAFLWAAATLWDGNWILHEPLIKYRRHANNTSTGEHRTIANQCLLMDMGCEISNFYSSKSNMSNDKQKIIKEYLEWAELRRGLISNHNILNFFRLIKYRKYFRSSRQELGDIYYFFKGK